MWWWIGLATYLAVGVVYSSWTLARYIEDEMIDWDRWQSKVLFVYVVVLWPLVMAQAVIDYLRREDDLND